MLGNEGLNREKYGGRLESTAVVRKETKYSG